MFAFAFVFIAHGTKQVEVNGLIKLKAPFFLFFLKKKSPSLNVMKLEGDKELCKPQIKIFSVINNQFLKVANYFSHQHLQRLKIILTTAYYPYAVSFESWFVGFFP